MAIEVQRLVTRHEGDDRSLMRMFDRGERRAQEHTRRLNQSLSGIGRGVNFGGGSGGILPGLAQISEVIQGIPQVGRLAGALTRPLTDAAEAGIHLNMVLETAKLGFEGMAGSATRAEQHVKALQAFAVKTPFRFEGLLDAARFMSAFGFEIDEQIPKLTAWGNAIAASGDFTAEKVHDVVRAFGQMRIAGRVSGQEMNQLINANIPGWELLAKAIGKTVPQTRALAEANKLNSKVAVDAITAMMAIDPRYRDMMKRMEKTTQGRLSAAQDVVQIGQGVATQTLTQDISATLEAALKKQDLAPRIASLINTAIMPVSGLVKTMAVGFLGSGIIDGLIQGLEVGRDAVKQAVGDFALDGIINTAKDWLGIKSPSTVFYEIGLQTAQGFALGLQDGFQDVDLAERLRRLMEDPEVRAFMEAIKKAEGGAANRIVGGGTFNDFSKHPNIVGMRTAAGPSTAAGSYQITGSTWRVISKALGLPDFSEPSQILAALEIFRRTGGITKLKQGDFAGAVKAAGTQWQALPGSSLGGKYHVSQETFRGYYEQALQGQGQPVPVTITGITTGTLSSRLAALSKQEPRGAEPDWTFDPRYAMPGSIGNPAADISGGADQQRRMLISQGLTAQIEQEQKFVQWAFKRLGDSAFSLSQAQVDALRKLYESKGMAAGFGTDGAMAQPFTPKSPIVPKSPAALTDIDLSGFKLELPLERYKEWIKTTEENNRLMSVSIVETGDMNKALDANIQKTGQAALGAGEWAKTVIQGAKSLREQLEELSAALPTLGEEFDSMVAGLPEGIGNVFGSAIQQWDGGFKSLFQSIGLGFADMLRDMAAQLMKSMVTKFLTGLLTNVLGAAVGGAVGGGSMFTEIGGGGGGAVPNSWMFGGAASPVSPVGRMAAPTSPTSRTAAPNVVINFAPVFQANAQGKIDQKSATQAADLAYQQLQRHTRRN